MTALAASFGPARGQRPLSSTHCALRAPRILLAAVSAKHSRRGAMRDVRCVPRAAAAWPFAYAFLRLSRRGTVRPNERLVAHGNGARARAVRAQTLGRCRWAWALSCLSLAVSARRRAPTARPARASRVHAADELHPCQRSSAWRSFTRSTWGLDCVSAGRRRRKRERGLPAQIFLSHGWLWRCLTYGRRQPLLRLARPSVCATLADAHRYSRPSRLP